MRIFLSSLFCGLIFTTTVYAVPATSTDQIISETEMVAVAPQSTAQNALGAPTQTLSPEVVVQNAIPQPAQTTNTPQEPLAINATGNTPSQGQLPAMAPETTNIMGPAAETTEPTVKTLLDRIVALEVQNTQMGQRVNLLEERLIGHVGEQKTQPCSCGKICHFIERLKNIMGPRLFMAIIFIFVVLLLTLVGYIVLPRCRCVSSVSYPQDDLPDSEHDFNPMEGQEGGAAKLNLARAYIAMGKESKAQGILYDVLANGSDAEQAEAKSLLEKMKTPNLGK